LFGAHEGKILEEYVSNFEAQTTNINEKALKYDER